MEPLTSAAASVESRHLRVSHHTGYRYSATVGASFNEVRMTPRDGDGQVLLDHLLIVDPAAEIRSYTDYWGAHVESFDVRVPHRVLEVTATSTVRTAATSADAPRASWDDVLATSVQDRWCEFLGTSGYVDDARADPQRAGLVSDLRSCDTPGQAVRQAVAAVRERLAYTPGVTHVSTTAGQAWLARHGVCQDFTHATLSLLRPMGIPARYVSGYLHSEQAAVGVTVHGESHAWVEVWDGDWWAIDPTNDRPVGPGHVVVVRGRDYADVPPLKGIYSGGRSEALGVAVEITQLAAADG